MIAQRHLFHRCLFGSVTCSVFVGFARSTSVGDPFAIYDGMYIVKLSSCNQDAESILLNAFKQNNCTSLDDDEEGTMQPSGCRERHVICSPEAATKLMPQDSATIVSNDAGASFRLEGNAVEWDFSIFHAANEFYSSWRSLDAIDRHVEELVQASEGIATLEELAPKTHEGRKIKFVRIRSRTWQKGGARVVLNFQIHAREWITGMTGVYTVENLIKAAQQDSSLLGGMEIVLVPITNPDGFAYSLSSDRMWRKNRRLNGGSGRCNGVDLNRNWGNELQCCPLSANKCSETYAGPSALSEPESQAMSRLIDESPTSVHVDVHCYGHLILVPPNRNNPKKGRIDEVAKSMQTAIRQKHGVNYRIVSADTSGRIRVYSTSKGAYGYTYELRPSGGYGGFAPPVNQILPTAEEVFQGLLAAIRAAKADAPTPAPAPVPPVTLPPISLPSRRRGKRRRRRATRRRRGSRRRRRRRRRSR